MLETLVLTTQGIVVASYIISLVGLIIKDVAGIRAGERPVPTNLYVYQCIRYSVWVFLASIALKVPIIPEKPMSLILYSIGLFLITFTLSLLAEVVIRFLSAYVSQKAKSEEKPKENLKDLYDTYGKEEDQG